MTAKFKPRTRTKKEPSPSIWHEEAHPALTHSLIAIGAFFTGVVILGALAVNAETSSSPTVISQLNELRVSFDLLTHRVEAIEEQLSKDATTKAERISNCDTLEEALPNPSTIRRISSSIACYEAPGINMPDKKFLSTIALYQYLDKDGDTQEIMVQIYDLESNEEAVESFLTKGAYLPVDYDRVKREDTIVNNLIGIFTYEGIPLNDQYYVHGANWFVVNDRFGIVVHGSPIGFTDREKLDELIEAVDIDLLRNIQ